METDTNVSVNLELCILFVYLQNGEEWFYSFFALTQRRDNAVDRMDPLRVGNLGRDEKELELRERHVLRGR